VPGVDRPVQVLRAGFKLSGGDPVAEAAPPALGADTDAVLAQAGYTAQEIDDMRSRGVL
jgi:crotonobetainyl-CoA:carnitine CoA-transferase CaiB-like acyl-CoA transferase